MEENHRPIVAVLAVQGAFIEHEKKLESLGAICIELRCAADLAQPFDALVLPGGESTVQGKLLSESGMLEPLRSLVQAGMPVLATCAGMILLAREIIGMNQPMLGLMNIAVVRNGFGRQVDSFETELEVDPIGRVNAVFIRAPYVERVWGPARVMASHDGKIVMAEEDRLLVTAFHPELTGDKCIHDYFLKKVSD